LNEGSFIEVGAERAALAYLAQKEAKDGMVDVKSVGRAIDILLAFTRERPSMNVAELQDILNIARPTLYRMLRTLEAKGLVRAVGDPRRYEIGARVMQLANIWLSQADASRVAAPFLQDLRRSIEETIAFSIPFADDSRVFAIELPSRHAIAFSLGVGHVQQLHVGASGKAILAFRRKEEREAFLSLLEPRLRKSLDAELARIRRDGFSLTEGEMIAGALATAAPVFDREGNVVGSVSIVGPEPRMRSGDVQRIAQEAARTASSISSALGYTDLRRTGNYGPGMLNRLHHNPGA
jgi:DNA-binding IclR family transcriptional regulator